MSETLYAIIEGGAVAGWSYHPTQPTPTEENPAPAQIDYRPLVLQWPEFDKATHQVGDPIDTIEPDRVVRNWVVSALPQSTTFADLSAVQVRLTLLANGITAATVQAAIASIADPVQRETAETYWEYSTSYSRNHPLMATFAGLLGLSDTQVNAMWRQAGG